MHKYISDFIGIALKPDELFWIYDRHLEDRLTCSCQFHVKSMKNIYPWDSLYRFGDSGVECCGQEEIFACGA